MPSNGCFPGILSSWWFQRCKISFPNRCVFLIYNENITQKSYSIRFIDYFTPETFVGIKLVVSAIISWQWWDLTTYSYPFRWNEWINPRCLTQTHQTKCARLTHRKHKKRSGQIHSKILPWRMFPETIVVVVGRWDISFWGLVPFLGVDIPSFSRGGRFQNCSKNRVEKAKGSTVSPLTFTWRGRASSLVLQALDASYWQNVLLWLSSTYFS